MLHNAYDWISKWALYTPNKIALKESDRGIGLSYGQLNQVSNHLAIHLVTEFQLTKGDRVVVLAENCLEYFMLFSAAQKTGIILVPFNYRLTTSELQYLFTHTEPRLTIVEDKFLHNLSGIEDRIMGPQRWSLSDVQSFCAHAQLIPARAFENNPISDDDPIFILYTSGTTGFPKGAIYTHKMLFWNSINTALSLLLNAESRTLHCLPPFHTGGWNVLSTPILHHGGYLCILKKFDPKEILLRLEEEKATLFMALPTMLKMMTDEEDFAFTDLSTLHYLLVGGEPMPIPLIEAWHQKGIPVRQGYGMTEVGPNLTSLHQDDAVRKKGSIGRPNFYVQAKIVDPQGARIVDDQTGELLLKGPMVTPGYWRDEQATAEAFLDGWFRTGDLVRSDAEGYLYIVDRIKNMYISGGENVYPAEVERVLLTHHDIAETAVVAISDPKWGEVGRAFVVTSGSGTLNEKQINDHCKTHLASFKAPKVITIVESLPKTETGKIDRRALRHQ